MINRFIRDTVNLLIYGGAFIGICASCITALTFELNGSTEKNLAYILFIGVATATLYTCHRVIGLQKLEFVKTSERFAIIRKYKTHIWIYCLIWLMLTIWFFIPLASLSFFLGLLPGGIIALAYVLPLFSGGRRLRDLGWSKIIMIGWSWGWLTAFVPLWFFVGGSIQLSIIHGVERMLFIILITIPFEIRDVQVDRSMGLTTLPEKFGKKKTRRIAIVLCGIIVFLSSISSFHYINPAYTLAMILTCIPVLPILKYSYTIEDDYFFGGLTDGLMILALLAFTGVNLFI